MDVMEDNDWTSLVNLDEAFEDDFNTGELEFEIDPIQWPGNPLALFRIFKSDGVNRTLEVKPVTDFFGDLPVPCTGRARDAFGLETPGQVNVTVLQRPDPPVMDQVGTVEVAERAPAIIVMNVTDPDLPDDVFTFSDDCD